MNIAKNLWKYEIYETNKTNTESKNSIFKKKMKYFRRQFRNNAWFEWSVKL